MIRKILLLAIAAIFTVSACSRADNTSSAQTANITVSNVDKAAVSNSTPANAESKKTAGNECRICDFDFAAYKGDLKKEEVEGLLLALNDEYLAAATYTKVNEDFNNPRPFVNIVEAEKRHAEMLKKLFTTYKIPVPENPWTGKVTKFAGLTEACKAGVDGEIVNRELYDRLFKTTAREDILDVYRYLQRASEENHLPAFERCGGGRGPGGGRRRGGL